MSDSPTVEPWFRAYYPDILRWIGLLMAVVGAGCLLFTDIPYERIAGVFPLATGLIFLKNFLPNGGSR